MALSQPSLLLYGYTVQVSNQYIDFQAVSMGPVFTATLDQGNFSLTDLLANIVNAMGAVDGLNVYSATVDRSIAGGTQNRITISTNGVYLKILFGTGAHALASIAPTIGFNQVDYSGQTSYSGSSTTGSSIIPTYFGYNWVAPTRNRKLFGAVNVSASGVKQAVVFQLQQFFRVEFRFESASRVDSLWQPFFDWASQQNTLEFTPDITSPSIFYQCTLESTEEAGDGLGWEMKEQLPEFPNLFQTGALEFRVVIIDPEFIGPV